MLLLLTATAVKEKTQHFDLFPPNEKRKRGRYIERERERNIETVGGRLEEGSQLEKEKEMKKERKKKKEKEKRKRDRKLEIKR